jgi:Phospholipase D Active site motif
MAAAKRGVYVRFVVVRVAHLSDANLTGLTFLLLPCSQNIPTALYPQTDVFSLVAAGAVDAQFINFTQLSGLSGVLHTKFMIADHSGPPWMVCRRFIVPCVTVVVVCCVLAPAMYVGSANMDWRSLAHVRRSFSRWHFLSLGRPSLSLLPSQVKELGLYYSNCSSVASELNKVPRERESLVGIEASSPRFPIIPDFPSILACCKYE